MIHRYFILALGVFACSTSVIMIKESTVHPIMLSGYRLIMAFLILLPLFIHEIRKHRATYTLRVARRSVLPAVFLALHFISWTFGARNTLAANASLLVNLTPITMPFVLYLFLKERVNRGEIIGTALSMTGVILMTAGNVVVSPEYLVGDGTCLVAMGCLTFYLLLARRNRHAVPSVWLYVIPMYGLAGLLCLLVSPLFTNPLEVFPAREYLLLLGLALVPTIIGHSLVNLSMRHLRPQIVSIGNQGQFLFSGILAFLFFGEVPLTVFYPACVLILTGVIIAIRFTPQADATG